VNLPSPKQLRYFLALVDEAHFGRAAAKCFVSQSAFSVAVKELETLLGVRLVDRTNRQVTITAMGQEFARQARDCLQSLETLVERAQGEREPLVGELRLGVIPTVAPFLLPRVLPKLRRAYPKLRLYLVEDQTERLHARLASGEIDLALLALPYELRGMEVLPLFKDQFRLACREGSALVKPGANRMAQLDPGSVLLLEDGHCLRDHALDMCRLQGSGLLNRFAAGSVLTLIEMVDADLGVSFLPEMAEGSSLLRNTRVRLLGLDNKSFRTIGLAWRKGSARSEEFIKLGEFFTANR
jgi:LysR family transcriptional regulator, hydrogen peroxide-inducible genes activator